MAERRMFAKTITNSDAFIDMPFSSQALYFHLSMNADDDGFINKAKSILRMIGAKDDDIKILIAKSFIIPFEDGIVVIKHWRINNYIQNDRHKGTEYNEDFKKLRIKENGAYSINKAAENTECIQDVSKMYTQDRLGKDSIDNIDILVNTRISSAEPNPVCSSEIDEKSIIELILNDKSTYSITQSKIDELKPLYPAIDILSELKKMQGWLLGNPKNRKTRSGIMRFITSWLCRAQDKSKSNTVSNKDTSNPFLQIAKDEGIL